MNYQNLKDIWAEKYKVVLPQLEKIKKIPCVATAFNANIDAVIKIKGTQIEELLKKYDLTLEELKNANADDFKKPQDIVRGIVKCFSRGIAEEWVTENAENYKWLEKNLGYHHLQMGGQGGIIANVMALIGIKKVVAHTNSHPQLQAKQFLNLDNLFGIDEQGKLKKAAKIARNEDIPMIHWIIEFTKGDKFAYKKQTFICPKSNRFIVTYDPLNTNLVINPYFKKYMQQNDVTYLILSGFHPILKENNGVQLIKNTAKDIKEWKKRNPKMIVHLEIASTQDKVIRKEIIKKIAPIVHSAGLNERETIDLLEVMGQKRLARKIEKETSAINLFEALMFIKEKTKIPRIQLHMFGLYITIQDEQYPFKAEQNLKGMMTASVISSSKALIGKLDKYENVIKTMGYEVSEKGIDELTQLSSKLGKKELLQKGHCAIGNYKISAVPTILIEKPKSLVGMGDTISSVSLVAGR